MPTTERERALRRLLRARDAIDRAYDQPLDVAALARVAIASEAHFIRSFRDAFGEPPHRYLQRRRLERAMTLLRTTELSVGEICVDVGMASAATFSRTFRDVVGVTPSAFRAGRSARADASSVVPTCFEKAWNRPSTAVAAASAMARGTGAA